MRIVVRAKAKVIGPSNDISCLNYADRNLAILYCEYLQR